MAAAEAELKQADIMFSFSYSLLSRAIATFQGKPAPAMLEGAYPPWSHVGVYSGAGNVIEATFPRARVSRLKQHINAGTVVAMMRVPTWSEVDRSRIVAAANTFIGRAYDKSGILLHLVDNFVERATWSDKKQAGLRPLARVIGDVDKDRKLFCSELVARSIEKATNEHVKPPSKLGCGYGAGNVRPLDLWRWMRIRRASAVVWYVHGKAQKEPPISSWV